MCADSPRHLGKGALTSPRCIPRHCPAGGIEPCRATQRIPLHWTKRSLSRSLWTPIDQQG